MILGSNIAFDCADALGVASWWRARLRYQQPEPTDDEVAAALVEHPEWAGLAIVDEDAHRHPRLFLQTVPEPKVERNRIRPVLALDHDHGLGADVEGNEITVVTSTGAPRLLAIEIDAADPEAQARFWCEALGFERDGTTCHPPAAWTRLIPLYPSWTFVPETSPKTRKNRLHFDFICSPGDAEHDHERLLALGAIDVVRHARFVTMQDPEGNELDLTLS